VAQESSEREAPNLKLGRWPKFGEQGRFRKQAVEIIRTRLNDEPWKFADPVAVKKSSWNPGGCTERCGEHRSSKSREDMFGLNIADNLGIMKTTKKVHS
jgi:hypothetical protein